MTQTDIKLPSARFPRLFGLVSFQYELALLQCFKIKFDNKGSGYYNIGNSIQFLYNLEGKYINKRGTDYIFLVCKEFVKRS